MKRLPDSRFDAHTGGVRLTFGEAARLYVSAHAPRLSSSWRREVEGMLRPLDPVFRDRVAESIQPVDIEGYRHAREAEGVATGSINREVALLGVVLSFGARESAAPEPSAEVRTKNPKDRRPR
jgi:hypothetical protein